MRKNSHPREWASKGLTSMHFARFRSFRGTGSRVIDIQTDWLTDAHATGSCIAIVSISCIWCGRYIRWRVGRLGSRRGRYPIHVPHRAARCGCARISTSGRRDCAYRRRELGRSARVSRPRPARARPPATAFRGGRGLGVDPRRWRTVSPRTTSNCVLDVVSVSVLSLSQFTRDCSSNVSSCCFVTTTTTTTSIGGSSERFSTAYATNHLIWKCIT